MLRVTSLSFVSLLAALPAQALQEESPLDRRRNGRRGLESQHARALERGLRWIASQQAADGSWATAKAGGGDVAMTGLALLAFLGDGSTMRSGPHKQRVKKGILWLKQQQVAGGRFGGAETSTRSHAIATAAMWEAYGLSKYRTLKRYAVLALDHLAQARNKDGGWGEGEKEDASRTDCTAWALFALRTAASFDGPKAELRIKESLPWLDRVAGATGRYAAAATELDAEPARGAARETSAEARTALATWVRLLCGQKKGENSVLAASAKQIARRRPAWTEERMDFAYWMHAAGALQLLGGDHAKEWTDALRATLAENQDEIGKWRAPSVWGTDGGEVWSTTLAVLALQASYRFAKR